MFVVVDGGGGGAKNGGNENERKEAKIVKFLQITNNTKSLKTFLRG